MRLFARLAMAITLALACVFPAFAAEKESAYDRVMRSGTLRCAYITWKPYNYLANLNDPKSRTGIIFDLMQQIGEVLDLKIEWSEEVGWGTIGAGFASGRYDMACIGMWPDAPKYKNFLLTDPLYYSAIYSWVRPNDARFDGDADKINAPGVKIAAVDGAFSYNLAKSVFPKAQIEALPPETQSAEYYMSVVNKKADVLNIDTDELAPFLETNPGVLRKVKNIRPLKLYPHVMALPASEVQLHAMINGALQFLTDNGALDALNKKYQTHYLIRDGAYQHAEKP